MRLLLDTSILIDLINNRRKRRELFAELNRQSNSFAITAINIAEIYSGALPTETEATATFLENFFSYDLNSATARQAGSLRRTWLAKGITLSLPDCLIAAVAIEHNLTLVTDNRKDFPMPELKLYPLPK